jgi:hypothetical protein
MLSVRPAKPSRFLACSEKKHVQVSVCLLPSSGLDHVGTFSTQTTQNCQSNTYLALCLQVLLALVALACVVLVEPQNTEVNRPLLRLRLPGATTAGPTTPSEQNQQYLGPSLGLLQIV